MAYENILYDVEDRLATITFNRPGRRNATNWDMSAEISQALKEAEVDTNVSVIILKGAGECFSSGYDLGPSMGKAPRQTGDITTADEGHGEFTSGNRLQKTLGIRMGATQGPDINPGQFPGLVFALVAQTVIDPYQRSVALSSQSDFASVVQQGSLTQHKFPLLQSLPHGTVIPQIPESVRQLLDRQSVSQIAGRALIQSRKRNVFVGSNQVRQCLTNKFRYTSR